MTQLKTQIVKAKKNDYFDKNLKLKLWQKSENCILTKRTKNQIVTRLKNSNSDKTLKL